MRVVAGSGSPLLVGFWRPVILFPAELLRQCRLGEIEMMLAHELAHMRRYDLVWSLLNSSLRAVFFFHPLVWLADRQSRAAQESACDELAMHVIRAGIVPYGELLLKVVGVAGGRRVSEAAALAASGNYGSLRTRLLALQNIHSNSRERRMRLALGIGGSVLLLLLPWQLVARASSNGDETNTERTERIAERDVSLATVKESDREQRWRLPRAPQKPARADVPAVAIMIPATRTNPLSSANAAADAPRRLPATSPVTASGGFVFGGGTAFGPAISGAVAGGGRSANRRSVHWSSDGSLVEIQVDSHAGITIRTQEGPETDVVEYRAKDAAELKAKYPAVFAGYKELLR
jgi:hypothetical protein